MARPRATADDGLFHVLYAAARDVRRIGPCRQPKLTKATPCSHFPPRNDGWDGMAWSFLWRWDWDASEPAGTAKLKSLPWHTLLLRRVAEDAMPSSTRCRGVGEEQRWQRLDEGGDVFCRYVPSEIGHVFFLGFLALFTNLGSRASNSHSSRNPLPMKRRKTPLIKTLTGATSKTRSLTEPRH
jgi:hypothetical protein